MIKIGYHIFVIDSIYPNNIGMMGIVTELNGNYFTAKFGDFVGYGFFYDNELNIVNKYVIDVQYARKQKIKRLCLE